MTTLLTKAATREPAVVAFGGGHGLAASLTALRHVTRNLTAVVTVADDGGSSGRLRTELGALPPGDLRMALAALAGPDTWPATWAELFQHRFGGTGSVAGHPVGNLVLAALAEQLGSPVAALDVAGRLLQTAGRVLPLSAQEIDIAADVAGLGPDPDETVEVRGQVAVATTPGRVVNLRLRPAAPVACAEVLPAVMAADWLVLGPGSLYTSVLPHLLVPAVRRAVMTTTARRVFVLNLVAQPGETEGYAPETHLEVVAEHAPDLRIEVVVADPATVPSPSALRRAAARLGARLELVEVAVPGEPRHDPRRLAAAFRSVFDPGSDVPPGTASRSPDRAGVSAGRGEG